MAKKMRKFIVITAKIAFWIFLAVILSDVYVASFGIGRKYDKIGDLPEAQAVLILGAAVYRGGQMSDVFQDRANAGLEVYRAGKVKKILVSGDHSIGNYDEVNAAKKFLLKSGVPGKDIFVDYAGFDTYDSVYRAGDIFQVESMIISTQDFHLPRALYLAKSLDIEAYGIKADARKYNLGFYNFLRENAARTKAFWDVTTDTKPYFLGDAIPITGDGRGSWD